MSCVVITLGLPVTTPLVIGPTLLVAGTMTGRVAVEKLAVETDDAEPSVEAFERR